MRWGGAGRLAPAAGARYDGGMSQTIDTETLWTLVSDAVLASSDSIDANLDVSASRTSAASIKARLEPLYLTARRSSSSTEIMNTYAAGSNRWRRRWSRPMARIMRSFW